MLTEQQATILRHPPRDPAPEGRWVALPAFRDQPRTFPLENLSESARALDRETRRR